jgi:hypothetical protein
VFNLAVGAIVGLILIGLPVAIIWLFIASVMDRRNPKPDRNAATLPSTSAPEADTGRGNRRVITYGRHPMVPVTSAEHAKPRQTAGLQGR